MKRNFYIENIKTVDDVNKITLLLNSLEEISRIKIKQSSISFECLDDTLIKDMVHTVDAELIIHEIINKKKRVYKEGREKKEFFFMFTNLETEQEANEIEEVLSKYSMYENVEIDFTNKLLKVTTNDTIVLKRLNRIVDKVNPNIDVEQWHKPFKSEDLFNQRYVKRYLRVSAFLLAIALALVSKSSSPYIIIMCWFVGLVSCSDKLILKVYQEFKIKKYYTENSLVLLGCILAFLAGRYVETIILVVLYQVLELVSEKIIAVVLTKIDNKVSIPVLGRKLVDGGYKMEPLEEFDIGDKLVVFPGETVGLGGVICKGQTNLDTFVEDGNQVATEVNKGEEISSGTVNLDQEIIIEVRHLFERSAFSKVLDIAALAPTYKSTSQKFILKCFRYFSYFLVASALLTPIILLTVDFQESVEYLYFSAILLSISGTFFHKQASQFIVLAGVAKAFQSGIIIKENSGLSAIGHCATIVYDRFDGVTLTDDEMEMFEKLKGLHKDFIVFNDGPIALENDQYPIYNDLSVEEKCEVMEKSQAIGPVLYIGDSSKDVALLQKAFVSVARGGLHDKEVVDNSDIVLTSSGEETILSMFKLAKKQNRVDLINIILSGVVVTAITLMALMFIIPWPIAYVIYALSGYAMIFNAYRILK